MTKAEAEAKVKVEVKKTFILQGRRVGNRADPTFGQAQWPALQLGRYDRNGESSWEEVCV